MKLISWNINGIRAVIKKGFVDWVLKEKLDVVCIQEIKISNEMRQKELDDFFKDNLKDYKIFWHSAERPGYSGTATFVRRVIVSEANQSRVKETNGVIALRNLKWDDEGRVQILDFGKFFLANVYFPNSNHELSRLDFKIKFNEKLLKHFKKLETKKPLIICGDYNVAHEEIDLARPKENVGNAGFTDEERASMTKFLQAGFVDVFRSQHKNEIKYSWWSYRAGARARNVGWRIDYFCVSKDFLKNIKKSYILDEVMGSDHCPVGIEL